MVAAESVESMVFTDDETETLIMNVADMANEDKSMDDSPDVPPLPMADSKAAVVVEFIKTYPVQPLPEAVVTALLERFGHYKTVESLLT